MFYHSEGPYNIKFFSPIGIGIERVTQSNFAWNLVSLQYLSRHHAAMFGIIQTMNLETKCLMKVTEKGRIATSDFQNQLLLCVIT